MKITPDDWTGPGSGANTVAPNVFQVVNQAASTSWAFTATARNASNALVTVAGWNLKLWDVTAGSSALTITGTSVNTISLSGNMLTNGHVYAYAVGFTSGTCDHTLITTTSIGVTAWKNYPVLSIKRGGVWTDVGGPGLRIKRGGVWSICNGGFFIKRANVWTQS